MNVTVGGLVLCVVVSATVGYSQNRAADPMTGTWKINPARSSGSVPQSETLWIEVADGVHNYKSDIVNADGSVRKSENHVKYNDGTWHPFADQATGQARSEIMMIKVDDRTWLRVGRSLDGKAGGVMMRRIAEDGKSYAATMLSTDGKIVYVRVFEKQ